MEAAALLADRRGGYAASAAAHERSARLTADPVMRGRRLAAAAMGARDSAQLDRAAALAQEASAMTEDPRTLAKLAWVRAPGWQPPAKLLSSHDNKKWKEASPWTP